MVTGTPDWSLSKLAFRVECKRTDADSIRIQRAWLDKIAMEALDRGEHPALDLEIGSGPNAAWIAIPRPLFARLFEAT